MTRTAHICRVMAIGVSLITSTSYAQDTYKRICTKDAAFKEFHGEYTSEVFFTALQKTRSIGKAFETESKAGLSEATEDGVAVSIGAEGISVSYGWHETGTADCVMTTGTKLRLMNSSKTYIRISKTYSRDRMDAPYFETLFKGCFLDELKQSWCFKSGAIEIAGKTHAASLELDPSEHEAENAVHIDKDHDHFWFFVPTKNGGWKVFQGGWSTDGSQPVDWKKPWRALTPVAANN